MRFAYEGDEFPGAFVEVSDSWSIGQRRRFLQATGEEWLGLWRSKIAALHLPALEGDPIDDPEQITQDGLDRLDVRLFAWLEAAIILTVRELANLGEAQRRALFDSYGKKPENSTATAA